MSSKSLEISLLSGKLEELLAGSRYENKPGSISHEDIPWLSLPYGFSFKVYFPFAGAAARFAVCRKDRPERSVSVYLDTQEVLGFCGGKPHWEAYPINDDNVRFDMVDGEGLIKAIVDELNKVE